LVLPAINAARFTNRVANGCDLRCSRPIGSSGDQLPYRAITGGTDAGRSRANPRSSRNAPEPSSDRRMRYERIAENFPGMLCLQPHCLAGFMRGPLVSAHMQSPISGRYGHARSKACSAKAVGGAAGSFQRFCGAAMAMTAANIVDASATLAIVERAGGQRDGELVRQPAVMPSSTP
jgi:hypothetical protein